MSSATSYPAPPAARHPRRAVLAAALPALAGLGVLGWRGAPAPDRLGPRTGDEGLAEALRGHLGGHRRVAIGVHSGRESRIAGFGADHRSEFEIGSITKALTGTLVSDAIQDGLVSLDSTVAEVFGDARSGASGPVTIRQLATHTSGLPRLGDPRLSTFGRGVLRQDPYRDAPEGVLEIAAAASRDQAGPFRYSNLGAALLGQVVAEVRGRPYEDVIDSGLAGPAGMPDTWAPITSEALPAGSAHGHDAAGRRAAPWTMHGWAPAGGVRSTVADMLTYLARVQQRPGDLEPLASTDQDGEVALCWFLDPLPDGGRMIWHNGMTAGFSSFIGWRADGQVGIVLLSDTARSLDDLGVAVLSGEVQW